MMEIHKEYIWYLINVKIQQVENTNREVDL